MAIRNGEQLLQSLRDDRLLFIDGERVGNVTTDPRFAVAARSLARLYDMQHDPALVERMTFRSPTSGDRVGLSFIEPRSVDDLIRRREMGKIWAEATCGMFGRSPDYMNIFVTGMASAADQFGHKDKSFAENIRAYHRLIARSRRASTRPMRWRSSTTCWCRGSASLFTAMPSCATGSITAPASCRRSCTSSRPRIGRNPSS